MGYTTDFSGKFNLNKPLSGFHINYLRKFARTRRMKRDAVLTAKLDDAVRRAVVLHGPGEEGGYYVGGAEYDNRGGTDVVDHNKPPKGQPGLWCHWVPTDDGTAVEWDGGEKFYDYVEWLKYQIAHFYQPWGYVLNGRVTWQGEERSDKGTIIVENNVVRTEDGHHADTSGLDGTRADHLRAALGTVPDGFGTIDPDAPITPFNLRGELYQLMTRFANAQGTDSRGAFRDVLTDMMHIAEAQGFDFDQVVANAREVAEEEDEG
jgi:hypothetical protein